MCHQSIGLIARDLEAAGITTTSVTSAKSITQAVNPPRAAFVDFPLGHTTGKPDEPRQQLDIVRAALVLAETAKEPGTFVRLPHEWGTEAWRTKGLMGESVHPRPARSRRTPSEDGNPTDARTPRFDTPQYQTEEDERLAAARLGSEVACLACAGFDH